MGLIQPVYTMPGQVIPFSNVYIAVAYNPIQYGWVPPIVSSTQPFEVSYTYSIWYNKDARINGCQPLFTDTNLYFADSNEIRENSYVETYSNLKMMYPDAANDP